MYRMLRMRDSMHRNLRGIRRMLLSVRGPYRIVSSVSERVEDTGKRVRGTLARPEAGAGVARRRQRETDGRVASDRRRDPQGSIRRWAVQAAPRETRDRREASGLPRAGVARRRATRAVPVAERFVRPVDHGGSPRGVTGSVERKRRRRRDLRRSSRETREKRPGFLGRAAFRGDVVARRASGSCSREPGERRAEDSPICRDTGERANALRRADRARGVRPPSRPDGMRWISVQRA